MAGAKDNSRNDSRNGHQRGDSQHRQSPERHANWAFGDPIFNDSSCVACHSNGAIGGTSDETVTQFGRLVDGQFDGLEALGGSLLQVRLYSDLHLHDMGDLADGIAQASAATTETKTAPLWAIRARTSFLHDGRASTIN